MLFQSWDFLVLMTVVMLGLAVLRDRFHQQLLILAASWFFYASWEPVFLLLLIYCTINDYVLGILIGDAATAGRKKFFMCLSLATNLGVLGLFKYYNFFIDSLRTVFASHHWAAELPVLDLVLPVGISFYTFHAMGYNIDVYRGKPPERSFLRFAIYVAFFPQLVAGPILRAGQFLPQLVHAIRFSTANLRSGGHLFLVGLVKKVVVADNVAPLVNGIFDSPTNYPSIVIWVGAFAFGVQIYCDFSGYTDMARGVSRMMSLEIPLNFRHPYFATSITDFWRRWHISLSSWLRDYLYIPLGGSRGGTWRTYRNLLLTMGLGGLWHGASWNFVFWGLYQGGLLAVERAWRGDRDVGSTAGAVATAPKFAHRASALLKWVVCQYFVFLGWVLFRVSGSLDELTYCVRKYVVFDFQLSLSSLGLGNYRPFTTALIVVGFLILHFVSWKIGGIADRLNTASRAVQLSVYAAAAFVIIALWPQESASFIYFQF